MPSNNSGGICDVTEGREPSPPDEANRLPSRCLNRRVSGEAGLEPKLEEWLRADPRNREAFDEALRVWRETNVIPEGYGGFDGTVMRAPFFERKRTHVGLATAAAVALAGLSTALLVGRDSIPGLVTPAQAAAYETRIGQIQTFHLPDSSAITLDTNSRVEVTLSGGSRHLEITRGRVRIENAAGTFTVTAGKRSATVKGAVFDVYLVGAALRISAPRSSVELSSAEPETGAPRQIDAGAQVEIGLRSDPFPVARSDLEWVSGMLALDGSRLGDAVAAINRYNRTSVRLSDPALASRKISGAFRASDPDAFAEAVARMLVLKISRPNSGKIVLSTR